jgi:hypothetical protein
MKLRFVAGCLLASTLSLAACAGRGTPVLPASTGAGPSRLAPDAASAVVWTDTDADKIRPTDRPGKGRTIVAEGALGESVSAQLMISATKALNSVDVSVGDLSDGKGHAIAAAAGVQLYREFYLNLTHPSGQFGHTGEYPDGLVPMGKDEYYHEQRNGAPFPVPAGKNQAVWIDFNIPANAAPGTYTGTAAVTEGGGTLAKVPVTLTVWNFSIPATASLPTAFGFDTWGTYNGHYGSHWNTNLIVQLTNLYQREALKHRISLYGNDVGPPTYVYNHATHKVTNLSFSLFDETVAPDLDGSLMPNHAQGTVAQVPYGQVPTPGPTAGPNDDEYVAFWKATGAYFKQKGWTSRNFIYDFDEPQTPSDFQTVAHLADVAHKADPTLRVMDTTTFRQSLAGKVDIWDPIVNELDSPGFPPPSVYAARQKLGEQVWFYTSNNSLNSYGPWPSFFVDASMNDARIFAWLARRYRLDGFLYYATTLNYTRTPNPWTNVYNFGDNGDGTLFYPGKVSLIGGKHDIPCDSIRLKEIRAALQDYEYMQILHKMGQDSFVDALVHKIAAKTNGYSQNGAALLAARAQMAAKIQGH